MGLWLVTWIVREAGGDVAFGEEDGRTAVTIRFPDLSGEGSAPS